MKFKCLIACAMASVFLTVPFLCVYGQEKECMVSSDRVEFSDPDDMNESDESGMEGSYNDKVS